MPKNQKISKKLSIAIPTYNRLNYLKECINSILNQTFQDFDIFVFDNASGQPIEEELKKFNDKRIHFIGSDKNTGGPGNAKRIREYPFESEYLTVFHDDDVMHPKMLELQTSFLDKNKDIVFVVTGFNRVYSKDVFKFQDLNEDKIEYIIYKNNYEFVKAIMTWVEYAFDSTMYNKVKDYCGLGGLDLKVIYDFNDIVSLTQLSQKGPSAFIKAPLVNYRLHPHQDSKQLELDKKRHESGAINTLFYFRKNLPPVLNRKDEKLFKRYSLNFLIRAYADINRGFFDFLRFMKRCRQKRLVKYRYFRYIDRRGVVSMISIILKNKKIIPAVRRIKDYLCKIFQ